VPVAEPEDYAPLHGVLFGDPPVDVAPLYVPTPDHVVLSVYQTERYMSDGHAIPQVAVVFAVPGLPGTFTRRIANYRFEEGVALRFLQERAELIRELYDL
jgi:predicted alpha/beta hydrolase